MDFIKNSADPSSLALNNYQVTTRSYAKRWIKMMTYWEALNLFSLQWIPSYVEPKLPCFECNRQYESDYVKEYVAVTTDNEIFP